ncbi:unnamed protein product [Clavelina lepadiformis]|uniref:Uncharacterized protein n=1 Tax=Clavelina lepadiformis TaxID=159417 RepID=A0ABP0GJB4_CLALP
MRLVLNGFQYRRTPATQVELVNYDQETLRNAGGGVLYPTIRNRRVILVEIRGRNLQEDLNAIQRQLDSAGASLDHPTGDIYTEMAP